MNRQTIQYSIVEHLRTEIPEAAAVLFFYDGLSLTDTAMPFFVVEDMPEDSSRVAANRDTYRETYRFQLAVRGASQTQLSHMAQAAKEALRKPIQQLDTSQQPSPTVGIFYADTGQIVPIRSESTADETNRHRAYIDVTVEGYVHGGEFTQ